jgi:hypothetical protein
VNDEILAGNLRAQNVHCADRFSRHRQCLARTCPFIAGNRRPTPSACASCYSRCNYDLCSARSSVPSRQSGTNACRRPTTQLCRGSPSTTVCTTALAHSPLSPPPEHRLMALTDACRLRGWIPASPHAILAWHNVRVCLTLQKAGA